MSRVPCGIRPLRVGSRSSPRRFLTRLAAKRQAPVRGHSCGARCPSKRCSSKTAVRVSSAPLSRNRALLPQNHSALPSCHFTRRRSDPHLPVVVVGTLPWTSAFAESVGALPAAPSCEDSASTAPRLCPLAGERLLVRPLPGPRGGAVASGPCLHFRIGDAGAPFPVAPTPLASLGFQYVPRFAFAGQRLGGR